MTAQLFPAHIPSPDTQRLLDLLEELGGQLAQLQNSAPGAGPFVDSIRAQAQVLARQTAEAQGRRAAFALRRQRLQAVRRALIKHEHHLAEQQKFLQARQADLERKAEAAADQQLLLLSLANEARRAPSASLLVAAPARVQQEQVARQRAALEEQAARQAQTDRWLEARTVELEWKLARLRTQQARQCDPAKELAPSPRT